MKYKLFFETTSLSDVADNSSLRAIFRRKAISFSVCSSQLFGLFNIFSIKISEVRITFSVIFCQLKKMEEKRDKGSAQICDLGWAMEKEAFVRSGYIGWMLSQRG